MQEAALRLYRKYGELKNKSLLFTAVRNLFYDQVRRSKVVAFDSLEDEELAVADTQTCHDRNEISEMLLKLKPQEREIIYLHYVLGYTASEIGNLTDRPRNTVLSLLSRSREKLRKLSEEPS